MTKVRNLEDPTFDEVKGLLEKRAYIPKPKDWKVIFEKMNEGGSEGGSILYIEAEIGEGGLPPQDLMDLIIENSEGQAVGGTLLKPIIWRDTTPIDSEEPVLFPDLRASASQLYWIFGTAEFNGMAIPLAYQMFPNRDEDEDEGEDIPYLRDITSFNWDSATNTFSSPVGVDDTLFYNGTADVTFEFPNGAFSSSETPGPSVRIGTFINDGPGTVTFVGASTNPKVTAGGGKSLVMSNPGKVELRNWHDGSRGVWLVTGDLDSLGSGEL